MEAQRDAVGQDRTDRTGQDKSGGGVIKREKGTKKGRKKEENCPVRYKPVAGVIHSTYMHLGRLKPTRTTMRHYPLACTYIQTAFWGHPAMTTGLSAPPALSFIARGSWRPTKESEAREVFLPLPLIISAARRAAVRNQDAA